MNKKEASNLLNEIFDTNIHWEKLSKSELEQLIGVLNDPRKVIKITLKLVSVEDLESEITKVIVRKVRQQVKDRIAGLEILEYAKKVLQEKL